MFSLFKRKKQPSEIDFSRLPIHIAIIMDGNGRWAKRFGLPRSAGHAAGSETFRKVATYCRDIGIKYLTVYAFSTENWKRPRDEVDGILDLLKKYLKECIEDVDVNRVKMRFVGDLTQLPPDLVELVAETERVTSAYEGTQVNICLNYGGRAEIISAVRSIAEKCASGQISAFEIDEAAFCGELNFSGVPDPDLIIRPSGEYRLSNFMLWQSAYAELYFTDVLWPDFNKHHLDQAIITYQQRSRRYGGLK